MILCFIPAVRKASTEGINNTVVGRCSLLQPVLYSYAVPFEVSLRMERFCFCLTGFYRLAQALIETGDAANAASAIEAGLRINSCEFGARPVPPIVGIPAALHN